MQSKKSFTHNLSALIVIGLCYWAIFKLYDMGFRSVEAWFADSVNSARVRWAPTRGALSVGFDVNLKGLTYPTLCFTRERSDQLSYKTKSRLEHQEVTVLANGDLTEESARALGCLKVQVSAHERPGYDYHVKGTISAEDLVRGSSIYCEVVTGRAAVTPDGFYVVSAKNVRSTRCIACPNWLNDLERTMSLSCRMIGFGRTCFDGTPISANIGRDLL